MNSKSDLFRHVYFVEREREKKKRCLCAYCCSVCVCVLVCLCACVFVCALVCVCVFGDLGFMRRNHVFAPVSTLRRPQVQGHPCKTSVAKFGNCKAAADSWNQMDSGNRVHERKTRSHGLALAPLTLQPSTLQCQEQSPLTNKQHHQQHRHQQTKKPSANINNDKHCSQQRQTAKMAPA